MGGSPLRIESRLHDYPPLNVSRREAPFHLPSLNTSWTKPIRHLIVANQFLLLLYFPLQALAQEAEPSAAVPQTWDRVLVGEGWELVESKGGYPLGVRRYRQRLDEGEDQRGSEKDEGALAAPTVSLFMLGTAQPFEDLTKIARTYLTGFDEVCGGLTVAAKQAEPLPGLQRLSLSFAVTCPAEDGPLHPFAAIQMTATRSGLYALVARSQIPDPEMPTAVTVCDIGLEGGCGLIAETPLSSDGNMVARYDVQSLKGTDTPPVFLGLSYDPTGFETVPFLRQLFDEAGAALERGASGVRIAVTAEAPLSALDQRRIYSLFSALDSLVRHYGYAVKSRIRFTAPE